ncbi:MAG: LLM class flavin-dependent oxidoreductase [Candidatus Binataceae bacterium]
MRKEIRLNAFDMNCVGHLSPGLWTHPRDHSENYLDLNYWIDLAKILERGKFDGLFIADVLGVYDVYGGNGDAALRQCAQVPVNDPVLTIPAMAYATRHLGFGVTCTLSFEPPYPFARRMSTLDHLTKGRIGWNIVTGYLDSAARGTGLSAQSAHDQRYEIAEEYMELMYKLWEGSWEEGAVVRDKRAQIYASPGKVHKVQHRGKYYQADAIHLCEPSPQRTPVLYQAGASTRGRDFAAKHAECVFVTGPSRKVIAPIVADIRRRATVYGRDPKEILVFALMTVVTGPTGKEARDKFNEYRKYINHEGALALFSGWTGVDFSQYGLSEPIRYIRNEAAQSAMEAFTVGDPSKIWTVREVAEYVGIGGPGPVVVGSPGKVADELQLWVDETDVDGFNLAYAVTPETFSDFVDLVVPELQRRGIYKTEYQEGTLREKLYGSGRARLPSSHPSASYRSVGSWQTEHHESAAHA